MLYTFLLWRRSLPLLDYRPSLLFDDQFPHVQPSDLQFFYVEVSDPPTLHS